MAAHGSFPSEKLRTLLERGIRLRREDRLEESTFVFLQAITLYPDSARARLELGSTLARNEQWREAVAAFGKAVELDPGARGIQEELRDLLTRLAEKSKAYLSYLCAIQQDSEESGLYTKIGDMLLATGDEERAAEAYYQAADLGWSKAREIKPIATPGVDCRELYLDLMKRCLTFLLWDAKDGPLLELRPSRPLETIHNFVRRLERKVLPSTSKVREIGLDWPAMALTMIGKARLDNVQRCVEEVLRNDVPGDVIEAGVWRGGVPIFMRAILQVHNVKDRVVWVADSFEGLPKPNVKDYPADRGYDLSVWRSLAVPLDEVRANFERFRLHDDQVRFLKGWFKDTLPNAPITELAVMRVDGDLYESTMDVLTHLYPKLSQGGYAIIDDYRNSPPCRKAVEDYRRQHGITDEIVIIDWSAAFWQRT